MATDDGAAYRGRFYTAQDGLRLFFRDYGDPLAEDAVLCLGGLARTSRDFDRLARRLAPRRVLAPDWRGRGRSEHDPDWRNYRPEVYLDDLRHLLTLLGIHRVVAVGTSLGGIVSMALTIALPATVAAVVLNDVGPEVERSGLATILDYVGRDRPQPDWPTAVAHMKTLLPTLSFRTDEDWLEFARGTFREGEDGLLHIDWDPAIVRPLRDGAPIPDLWPLFSAVGDRPMLVVRGGVSTVLAAATLDRMAERHPGLRSVTLPGVGHAPSLDEPEAKEAIDEFLGCL